MQASDVESSVESNADNLFVDTIIKIHCADGKSLEFPLTVLLQSPYIHDTLLRTHFLGEMGHKRPFCVSFQHKYLMPLIPFIREGKMMFQRDSVATNEWIGFLKWITSPNPSANETIEHYLSLLENDVMDLFGRPIEMTNINRICTLNESSYFVPFDNQKSQQLRDAFLEQLNKKSEIVHTMNESRSFYYPYEKLIVKKRNSNRSEYNIPTLMELNYDYDNVSDYHKKVVSVWLQAT